MQEFARLVSISDNIFSDTMSVSHTSAMSATHVGAAYMPVLSS